MSHQLTPTCCHADQAQGLCQWPRQNTQFVYSLLPIVPPLPLCPPLPSHPALPPHTHTTQVHVVVGSCSCWWRGLKRPRAAAGAVQCSSRAVQGAGQTHHSSTASSAQAHERCERCCADTVLELQAIFLLKPLRPACCLFGRSVDGSRRVKLLVYDSHSILTDGGRLSCVYCADLRYHHEHHVRCLAAETFGFLLRAAPRKSLRAGMRALLAEHAGAHTPVCLITLTQHRTQLTHHCLVLPFPD